MPDNFERLRRDNFGVRVGGDGDAGYVTEQLRAYDASAAAEVSKRARSEATLDRAAEEILALYREAIDAHAENPPEPASDARGAAAYLEEVSRMLTRGTRFRAEREVLRRQRDAMRRERDHAVRSRERLGARLHPLRWLRRLSRRG
jgi:hypothetical protein